MVTCSRLCKDPRERGWLLCRELKGDGGAGRLGIKERGRRSTEDGAREADQGLRDFRVRLLSLQAAAQNCLQTRGDDSLALGTAKCWAPRLSA